MQGAPNLDLISTSYADRSNPTIRASQRRLTRITSASAPLRPALEILLLTQLSEIKARLAGRLEERVAARSRPSRPPIVRATATTYVNYATIGNYCIS